MAGLPLSGGGPPSAPPPSDVDGAYPAIQLAPPQSSTSGVSAASGHPPQHPHPGAAALPSLSGGGGGGGASGSAAGGVGAPQLYENSPRAGSNPLHRILVGSGSGGRHAASGGFLGGFGVGFGLGGGSANGANGHHTAPVPAAQQQHPPSNLATARRPVRDVTYGARTPIRRDVSWLATFILVAYVASLCFYIYVRVMMLLPSSPLPNRWYSALVFAIELLGATAVLPYALLNTSHLHATGSPGLPEDDGAMVCSECPFHVRVLVCCYKEPLDVVTATAAAALDAVLPPSTLRSVYLCDDGKDDAKRAWIEATYGTSAGAIHPPAPMDHPRALPRALGVGTQASLAAAARFPGRDRVYYVGDRVRKAGEINGKSANLNNCLTRWIYKDLSPDAIPSSEIVVIFDADMQADASFFLKLLEPLTDKALSLVLTPQSYTNVFAPEDIFNNINTQWWQYSLPGLTALGYVACTGTNFAIRAKALAACSFFPTHTITEDFALGMELRARGFKGTYLNTPIARGEAPTELRNIFRQRSRWCKGHWIIFWSRHNPLWRRGLPVLQRLLYNNGTFSYLVTVIATPAFVLIPFLGVFAGLNPVLFTPLTPLALTLYLVSGFLVQSYVHTPLDSQALWLASLSNQLLAFTYFKAIVSVFLSKVGIKRKTVFKVTAKGGGVGGGMPGGGSEAAAPPPASARVQAGLIAFGQSVTRRFGGGGGGGNSGHGEVSLSGGVPGGDLRPVTAKELITPPPKAKKRTEEDTLTEKCVFFAWAVCCCCTITLALHTVIIERAFGWATALTVCWAVYNAIPPVLFFLSIWASTQTMTICVFWLQVASMAASAMAVVSLWFVSSPTPFSLSSASPPPPSSPP